MKKIIISLGLLTLGYQTSKACTWYDPDYEYFNVFAQNIIQNKAYSPFLLTYSEAFYTDKSGNFSDENIEDWQKYFQNKLTYSETYDLVYKMPLQELNDLKKGKSSALFQKLGSGFYNQYHEGLDYLIEAKYLEPFMNIIYVENPDSFYYREGDWKNAGMLNYDKTVKSLESLYNFAQNPTIKLRYGYQLVRFQHYNRKYDNAIQAFKQFVEPLQLKTAPYFLALNQYAGAQRGLGKKEEANWNFFQVFMHSNTQKTSAYSSIRLNDENAFKDLLSKAKSPQEKEMVYFLLGYQDFNKPLPMMKKIYELNPKSELLQVLAARAVNELERDYLPTYYDENGKEVSADKEASQAHESSEPSLWKKIWNFIKSLFSDKKEKDNPGETPLQNPNRIPFFSHNANLYSDETSEDKKADNSLAELLKFVEKEQGKNPDEFWKITAAYLHFLNKDYSKSNEVLDGINSKNAEYVAEINKMKMLNAIVGQPTIDASFENVLFEKYASTFVEKKDSLAENPNEMVYVEPDKPNTNGFLRDILANRYFLQGDRAKAFLMNNKLSDFRNNPDETLAKALWDFSKKQNKNNFEQKIIAENMNDVGDIGAYFNLVFGDFAMRNADFQKAHSYYDQAKNFAGYALDNRQYNYETNKYETIDTSKLYNGFDNISGLVFGHNIWESFTSNPEKSMKAEDFIQEFPFIAKNMNKLQISQALIDLKKIGEGKDEKAAKANQLIGNLLYNTSSLGYFRDVYMMDINNVDGGKYRFASQPQQFNIYYKNYSSFVFAKPDNFDLSLGYYTKALQNTNDKEQKARIVFQMASAEQGKYYQNDETLQVAYEDVDYDKKMAELPLKMDQLKNSKYRTYFNILRKEYADTETSKLLMGSCSYYNYFMKK